MSRRVIFFIMLFLLLLSISVYAAETEDFESYDKGTLPSEWISGYNIGGYGVQIASDPENADNNVIEIKGNAVRTTATYYLKQNYSGKLVLEYDVYIANKNGLQHLPGPAYSNSDVVGAMTYNGYIIFGGGSNQLYKSNFNFGAWNHIRIELDTGALTYQYFLNGETQFSGTRNINATAFNGINQIVTTVETSTLYIDNISIEKIADSTEFKYLFYSTKYAVDRTNFTIGDLNYYDSIDMVIDSLVTAPGVAVSVSNDEITVSAGERCETYNVIKRKNPMPTYKQDLLNSMLVMKAGEDAVLKNGTICYSGIHPQFNSKGEIVVSVSLLEKYFPIETVWNAERFGTLFGHNGYTYFKRAPYAVGNLDGYRIKVHLVSQEDYENNLYLTETELEELGMNLVRYGDYLVFNTDKSAVRRVFDDLNNIYGEV